MRSILLVVTSPKEDRNVSQQLWQEFLERTTDALERVPPANRISANSWLLSLEKHLTIFAHASAVAQDLGLTQRSLIVDTESSWLVSRPEVISED